MQGSRLLSQVFSKTVGRLAYLGSASCLLLHAVFISKGKNIYELDFIPVFYNEDLDDHYIHIRLFKFR
jgi:hypothetical protein